MTPEEFKAWQAKWKALGYIFEKKSGGRFPWEDEQYTLSSGDSTPITILGSEVEEFYKEELSYQKGLFHTPVPGEAPEFEAWLTKYGFTWPPMRSTQVLDAKGKPTGEMTEEPDPVAMERLVKLFQDSTPPAKPLDYFETTPEGMAAAKEALKSYPPGYRILPVGQGAVQIFPPEEQKPPSQQFFGPTAQADAEQAAAESPDRNDYASQIGNSGVWEVLKVPTATDLEGAKQEALLNGDFGRAQEIQGYIDQFSARDKQILKRQQEQDTEARVQAAEAKGERQAAAAQQQKESQRNYELDLYQTQMQAWENAQRLGRQQGLEAQKSQYLGVLGALNPKPFGPEGIPKPDFLSQAGPMPVAPVAERPYPAGFESFRLQNTPGAFGAPVPEMTPEEKAAAIERYRRQQLALTAPAPTAAFRPPLGSTREFALPLTDEQAAAAEEERRRQMVLGTREAQLLGIAEG